MDEVKLIEIIAILVSFFSLVYVCVSIVINKKNERSMQEKITKVIIDYEREQMEKQMYAQADMATSNPLRFSDMNHLLLHNLNGELKFSNTVTDNSFFEDHGINLADFTVQSGFVACLMPFISSYKPKYEAIRLACADAGLHCHRSDEEFIPGDILKYTIEMILRSQIVIAVLDGRNANVYYEMGIAQSIGKPVIMVADDSKMGEIPFDVKSNRMLFYKNHNQLRVLLREVLINNTSRKDESGTKERDN